MLQGHWKLDNEVDNFEISGTQLTVVSNAKPATTSFQLIRNMQLGNWQIKMSKPLPWLRTFIVRITDDSFMLYDYDVKGDMTMGARSKLLNPKRTFKYTRVAVTA